VRFIDDITPRWDARPAHPLQPLDLAADRCRFQFSMIASYLTGFLISGVGFGAIVAANSRAAASGASGRMAAAVVAAAEKPVAECDRNAAVTAMSKATITNAEFNSRFMENLHSSGPWQG
jgi:hypothetical protein